MPIEPIGRDASTTDDAPASRKQPKRLVIPLRDDDTMAVERMKPDTIASVHKAVGSQPAATAAPAEQPKPLSLEAQGKGTLDMIGIVLAKLLEARGASPDVAATMMFTPEEHKDLDEPVGALIQEYCGAVKHSNLAIVTLMVGMTILGKFQAASAAMQKPGEVRQFPQQAQG